MQGVAPQLEYEFIERAHHDHCDLVTAIERREGMRAEFIMREHARKTRENKQRLLAS
jgi:GntR family transcriptional regulator of vanillate catabolism